jgi:dipeptidyl aminopeptidase/acylaminoacyl peptidase
MRWRLALFILALPAAALAAQEKPSDTLLTVNHYLDYETVADVRISPDGARIIYTRRYVNKQQDRFESALWIMNADGSENRFLTKGSNPNWSPDGTRIAFLNDGEPRGTQIFVRWMNAEGATSQVTRVEHDPGDIAWSPDGKWIGFSMFTPKPNEWKVDLPAAPAGAQWTPAPRYVSNLHYRADRRGFLESGFVHLFMVPADGGTARGTWVRPTVSPDGQWIAFAGYAYTPQTYKTSELFVMRSDGSGMKKISATMDRDAQELTWAPDNSGVYFSTGDRGTMNVHFASVGGSVRQLTSGMHMLPLGSMSRGGVVASALTGPQSPPDVVRWDVKTPNTITRLTRVNEDVLANKKLGAVEEIWYTSTSGTRVQGWIVKPPNFESSRKYPLIMEIHGGPHGMYNVGFSYMYQNFAANGYVVLYTNPRGSTGYGTDFGNAINKRYPGVDYDDLIAGVDTVVGRGYIDQTRMYVGGCSGGGVLSSWVISHTNRFAAAAVRCPVMNWISFAGNADIPYFGHAWFEKPFWEDPKPWLDQSPLMHVGNVTTPTVIMTGELDLRTPMAQSEEYYAALKMRGVPTALLRFQNEYHGTSSRPSNFMRTQLYMMSWYQKFKREAAM